ncbi:MAG: histidine phosphatase family protein [Rhodospirillales bacterium]|nr:histidine phosphatase family protein [Rhodospirillales bacterium]
MSETRWWWIRHAKVKGGAGTVVGRTDLDADLAGIHPLPGLPDPARVIATPLKRTQQTLAALGRKPDVIEPAFLEQDFGLWQGRRWDEIGGEADSYWADMGRARPPEGESFADVVARVAVGLHRHGAEIPEGDVLALAHAGSIRAALALALDLSPAKALALTIDNLSLTRLSRTDQGWRVEGVNLPLFPGA